jgi:hypothetical protein
LEAYEQIGEEIPLLEQYKAIFDYSPYMRKVLGLIYFDILEFHKRAIRFFSGRGKVPCPCFCCISDGSVVQFGIKSSVQRGKILGHDSSTF